MNEVGCLWKYALEQGGNGIVFADNEAEAIERVVEAYTKHGGCEGGFSEDVTVYPIDTNAWFADCPNVLEIDFE